MAWIAELLSIPGEAFHTILHAYQAPSHLLLGLAEMILKCIPWQVQQVAVSDPLPNEKADLMAFLQDFPFGSCTIP